MQNLSFLKHTYCPLFAGESPTGLPFAYLTKSNCCACHLKMPLRKKLGRKPPPSSLLPNKWSCQMSLSFIFIFILMVLYWSWSQMWHVHNLVLVLLFFLSVLKLLSVMGISNYYDTSNHITYKELTYNIYIVYITGVCLALYLKKTLPNNLNTFINMYYFLRLSTLQCEACTAEYDKWVCPKLVIFVWIVKVFVGGKLTGPHGIKPTILGLLVFNQKK